MAGSIINLRTPEEIAVMRAEHGAAADAMVDQARAALASYDESPEAMAYFAGRHKLRKAVNCALSARVALKARQVKIDARRKSADPDSKAV